MPLPIINLDDRRFEELAREARERLASHTPEWSQLHPGDPANAFVDLFAWLGETILYRANLIPERQRRAFLNLLRIPLRPARPAGGVVAVDCPGREPTLPAPLAAGAELRAGDVRFTTLSEVQPTWLTLTTVIKEGLSPEQLSAAGVTLEQLQDRYGADALPFQPRQVLADGTTISLTETLDASLYLAFSRPAGLKRVDPARLREELAGRTLSLALAPPEEREAEEALERPTPRRLLWELASWDEARGSLRYLPLEVVSDGGDGARRAGVVRLRLPARAEYLAAPPHDDPLLTGHGTFPPELPAEVDGADTLFWIRLRCPEEPLLGLAHLEVNGVEVIGQATERNRLLGVGDNRPEQSFTLPHRPIDPESLVIEVEEQGDWVAWLPVEHFGAARRDDPVYTCDPERGMIRFGDGLRGRRVPAGMRVRAAHYRWGGGAAGNLAAGAIKELAGDASLKVRHTRATRGGRDGESVAEAERRIPAFLAHRERAVTTNDFRHIALDCPTAPVARAEVIPGLIPGNSKRAVRENVPGAVSLFVLPPAARRADNPPRPSAGMLRDLFDYLTPRRLIGTELYVLSPEFVDLAVSVRVELLDYDNERAVLAEVEQAVVDYLWALPPGGPLQQGWPLGRSVSVGELETRVARVDGVLQVNEVALFAREAEGAWSHRAKHLALTAYQLPNLVGIEALNATASGTTPQPPRGLRPEPGGGGNPVPVLVIPEIC